MERALDEKQESAEDAAQVTPEMCAGAVMEAVPLVMRYLRDTMHRQRDSHLSVPQFRILAFLARHPGVSMFAVADHLGVARPTASIMVDRLVRQGLVVRTDDPTERRRAVLRLTAGGARQFQEARDATQAWLAGILREQPSFRLRQILQGMQQLASAFTVSGEDNHER